MTLQQLFRDYAIRKCHDEGNTRPYRIRQVEIQVRHEFFMHFHPYCKVQYEIQASKAATNIGNLPFNKILHLTTMGFTMEELTSYARQEPIVFKGRGNLERMNKHLHDIL